MEIIKKSELFLERASRGYIQGWYTDDQPVTDKPYLNQIINIIREEPTVKAALRSLVDEIVKNGYRIKSDDPILKQTIEKELANKYRIRRLLKKIVWNALVYQNVFIEIVYKNNEPEELHVLDTEYMEIIANEHGEVEMYVQDFGDRKAEFSPDECVHISLDNITSALWGEVDLKVLQRTVALKRQIETFLYNLFKYDKFRDAWRIKEAASQVQIEDFINQLKDARLDPTKEIVVQGEIEKINGREIKELDKLVELLNYTRQQILTLLRVPPIIAGIPDNSNRSNSEVQARKAFDGRVISIQKEIADEISWELFPKLGWGDADFEFAPIDKRAEKDDIEIIKALADIGLDDESLLQLIRDVGIQIRDEAFIKSSIDNNQSKELSSDELVDEASPVEHKTGEEAETREDQLMGRSEEFALEDGFDQYAEEVLGRKGL